MQTQTSVGAGGESSSCNSWPRAVRTPCLFGFQSKQDEEVTVGRFWVLFSVVLGDDGLIWGSVQEKKCPKSSGESSSATTQVSNSSKIHSSCERNKN